MSSLTTLYHFNYTRTINEALLTSFIVSYGRGITKSHPETLDEKLKKNVINDFKNFIKKECKNFSIEQQEWHKHLLKARNEVFAHSDTKTYGFEPFKILDSINYIGRDPYKGYDSKRINNFIEIIDIFINSMIKKKGEIEVEMSKHNKT